MAGRMIYLLFTLLNYIIITTIINFVLQGAFCIRISFKCKNKEFLITRENRFDMQSANECSAFSAAYVLRHWGMEENGSRLYEIIPNKYPKGTVAPKGIRRLLFRYGFQTKCYAGNLTALKNEVSKGNPVIVLIRTQAGKNWLHFVPVVGYDEQHIFIAESLDRLVNCEGPYYNRKIEIKQFVKLWNTSMLFMPLYRNTYITARKKTT